VGGQEMVVFGGGDGYCYGFAPEPVDGVLKELWRCNCNPVERRIGTDGKPLKYGSDKGPCEVIATPVIQDGKVYVAIGQDPESSEGPGALVCIDPSTMEDFAKAGIRWKYLGINRSISAVSISNGLIFVADFSGIIHCVDAASGKEVWTQDTEAKVWGSTLVDDGKLFLGNESGAFTVMAADRVKRVIGTVNFDGPVYSSAVVANGVMFVATDKYVYAIGK
jgi:outer membrane protein assembly factor BamB